MIAAAMAIVFFVVPVASPRAQAQTTLKFVVDLNGRINVGWEQAGKWENERIGPWGMFPPGAPLAASQQFGFGGAGATSVFAVDWNGTMYPVD
jgi:hypothetical protein